MTANSSWRNLLNYISKLNFMTMALCHSCPSFLHSSSIYTPFSNSVYALDSTIIDMCLGVFCWATFRTTKATIKLHTQYDVRTAIPVFVHLTAGSVHDTGAMDELTYEPGSFYIFDRGYIDFERLFVVHESKSFFVIRAKSNLRFKRKYSATVDKSNLDPPFLYLRHLLSNSYVQLLPILIKRRKTVPIWL